LMRLTNAGLLHRLADGFYVVVPHELAGNTQWVPTIEAAAAGIATAEFGPGHAALMGLTAARLHGVLPRALAVATVAAPRRRRNIVLRDRQGGIRFRPRDVTGLDLEMMHTELGPTLVTTPEQTVLDLAHRPADSADRAEADAAVRLLLPRCDKATLDHLASEQHLRPALRRAYALSAT
jgi:hypothetical protein